MKDPQTQLAKCFGDVIQFETSGGRPTPSIADKHNSQSLAISKCIVRWLGGNSGESRNPQTKGAVFEACVRSWIEQSTCLPDRIRVHHEQKSIQDFTQYSHLASVEKSTRNHPLLQATMSGDYRIRPDIAISSGERLLASVSCKITLRSDRAQNARSEALNLLRLRNGPAPRICLVTCEPLPKRLESVARGTGDLDAVFHVALPALLDARHLMDAKQKHILDFLVNAGRLLPLNDLGTYLFE